MTDLPPEHQAPRVTIITRGAPDGSVTHLQVPQLLHDVLSEDEEDDNTAADSNVPQRASEFIVPHRYELWADGHYLRTGPMSLAEAPDITNTPSPERRKQLVKMLGRPVWINRFGVDKTTGGELVELGFTDSHHTPCALWVPREILAVRSKAVTLSSRGLPVHDGNIKEFQYYIDAAINLNAGVLPRVVVTSRVGAYAFDRDDGSVGHGWLFGPQWVGPDSVQIVLNEQTAASYALGYTTSGSEERWRQRWAEVTNAGQLTRWLCYSTFAAPLLRHLHQRAFVVHHWGANIHGKSALARFALSAWGDPRRLEATGFDLNRGLPPFVLEADDLPVFIDDLNLGGVREPLRLVHGLTQARRRTAQRPGGPAEAAEAWHAMLYTTGTREVYEEDTYESGGLSDRVLQIGEGDLTAAQAEALHTWGDERCFGWGGLLFLHNLALFLNQPGGQDILRTRYREVKELLVARSGIVELPRLQSFAVCALAQACALTWFYNNEWHYARNTAVSDAIRAVQSTLRGVTQAPLHERALQLIASETTANHKLWLDLTTPKQDYADPFSDASLIQQGKWGQIAGVITPNEIWMIGPVANELLKRHGLKPRDVWAELERIGALVTYRTASNKAYTVQRSRGHFNDRVYAIRRAALQAAVRDGREG